MLLKPAKVKNAFAKVGIYGGAGSGKTRTAVEIAIGLHHHIKSKKPIAVFDTEPGFSWVLPIFEKEGIEVLICDSSRSLEDLMQFVNEAKDLCDIVIVDSITHIWKDAQESYLNRVNDNRRSMKKRPLLALEFQMWQPIKAHWARFTNLFMSSDLHFIICGRAGTIYEFQDRDDGSGKKDLISTGIKMATEKELGYEPSLLIEMTADRLEGKIVNNALIQKDRADKLNGDVIPYPNFDKLFPHFNMLNLGGESYGSMDERNSQGLYAGYDEQGWDKEKKEREIQAEEIQGILVKYYPGQTADHKKAKSDLLEQFFKTRSWAKVEQTNSKTLKSGYRKLKSYLENLFEENKIQE